VLGRAMALQFHPEIDGALLDLWLAEDRDGEVVGAGLSHDELRSRTIELADCAARRIRDLVGGFLTNTSLKPGKLQIQYAGTGEIKLGGGSQSSALVYAPNAAFSFNGGGDFYGAVVSKTVTDLGNSKIHVDRNLSQQFSAVGNSMMSSFSWKKY